MTRLIKKLKNKNHLNIISAIFKQKEKIKVKLNVRRLVICGKWFIVAKKLLQRDEDRLNKKWKQIIVKLQGKTNEFKFRSLFDLSYAELTATLKN